MEISLSFAFLCIFFCISVYFSCKEFYVSGKTIKTQPGKNLRTHPAILYNFFQDVIRGAKKRKKRNGKKKRNGGGEAENSRSWIPNLRKSRRNFPKVTGPQTQQIKNKTSIRKLQIHTQTPPLGPKTEKFLRGHRLLCYDMEKTPPLPKNENSRNRPQT